jgi:long-chain acyl-CoA synthetase
MGGLGSPMRWTDDAIGDVPACIEIKLVDFPEAGYYSHSHPPQGEIWIRGTAVMEGYYHDEQQTAEALTPDGWLKTGDIGEWDKNGHLKIIDRKKNLVKTMNGEYIALEKVLLIRYCKIHVLLTYPQLESIYRSSPLVSNICVYASPDHAKPIAIIMPAEPAMKELAAANSIPAPDGIKSLLNNEKFQDIVLKEIQAAGRKGGLSGIELVSGVVLVHEEWTPQNVSCRILEAVVVWRCKGEMLIW